MPRWLKLILAAVIVPVVLLAGVEGVLRLIGYGTPTTLFVPVTIEGRPYAALNQDISSRFFSNPHFAGTFTPLPDVFPRDKGTNTFRVFVFGESAARGMFYESFSFGCMLREMLAAAHPDRAIEVINTGVNAIDSWVVRAFAKEALAYQPDLFVFYCGNNELVGPFGPASLSSGLGATGRMLSLARLWLTRLRVSQLAGAVNMVLTGSDTTALSEQWQAVQMQQRLSHDDPRRAQAYAAFLRNLGDMMTWAAAAGVPSIVCTLGANIADFPPAAPLINPRLSAAQRQALTTLVGRAQAGLNEHMYTDAMAAARAAAQIDPSCADALFVLGRCNAAEGALATARYWCTQATICDGMPTRTGPELNPMLRSAFGHTQVLCDTAVALAAATSNGMIGSDMVFDQVHLTLAGHYAVASSLFHAVEAVWPGRAAGAPPITAERCFERLGCSRWDVCLAYHETAKFLLGNATFSNHLHYSGWNTDVRQRYGAFIKTESWRSDPGLLDEAIGVYSNALAAQPGSWDLLRRLARAYATRKNYDAAIATGARAYALNPFCEADTTLAEAYRDRAAQRMDAGDPAGAADDLGMAITLLQRVHSVTNQARACALRAQALLKLKRFGEVVSSLDEALALQPGDADWHNARGFAHFQLGEHTQAVKDYTRSLELKELQGQVYYNRAYAYASLKQYRKAAADVVAALQLNYPVEPQFVNFLKAKELEQKRRR